LEVAVKLIGLLLIVFGVVALAVGAISYTKREKVIDLGPIQATAEKQKTIPLSPIAGLASIAGGIEQHVSGSRQASHEGGHLGDGAWRSRS